jgi:cytochrome P450
MRRERSRMFELDKYDPYHPSVAANPYLYYAELRIRAPVHHLAKRGFWVLSGWKEVQYTVDNMESFSADGGVAQVDPLPEDRANLPPYAFSVGTEDPPNHTRLRRILHGVFSPRMVSGWKPMIRSRADKLIQDLQTSNHDGSADVGLQLAQPLPAQTLLEIMGLPQSDAKFLNDTSDAALRIIPGPSHVGMEVGVLAAAASQELAAYCEDLIADRRKRPRGDGDFVTELINGVDAKTDTRMSQDELIGHLGVLFVGGLDTTRGLIGNGTVALCENPEEQEAIKKNIGIVPQAVEEMLRYDPPVHGSFRDTVVDVEISGVTIPAGERVQMLWASANRDSSRYGQTAEEFLVTERRPPHGSFGLGIHHCVGAQLARVIACEAFESLFHTFDSVSLRAEPEPYYENFPGMRRRRTVPVKLVESTG